MKLDLTMGAQVYCMDQSSGKLVEIVVDPATQQVTELIVQKGLLRNQEWVLPLTALERVTGNALYLNLHSDQLSNYPEYRETEVSESAEDGPQTPASSLSPAVGLAAEPAVPMVRKRQREGIVTGRTVISAKSTIRTPQEAIGTVDHVLIDRPSGQIAQLVVRKGFFPQNFIIPQEAIDQITDDGILVKLNSKEVAALPRYESRSDEAVVSDIQRRLQEGWPSFTGVLATCEAGSVRLFGYVRSKPLWYHAAELAQIVEGVIDVQNDLVVDPDFVPGGSDAAADLARQVHHALITDARTDTAVIDVVSDQDTLILQGKVESEEIRRCAEEIALQQPGVTAVDNRLTVAQAEEAPKLHYS